ncbi:TonB-dependent receptor [Peristeroidobacter soli]|uniref:TonB-dependent receptor n=1 Tax=Peristeroidobacter soli TaxID=2497877 RepID=UPI00101C711B|nr:TonB-dependent receptor [Peristeroidobacter soli]
MRTRASSFAAMSARAAVAIVIAQSAHAEDAARHAINIDSQPVGAALQQLAAQTNLQILVFSQDAQNKQAPAVHGTLTADEALVQLLRDTGLTYEKVDAKTIAVKPVSNATTQPGVTGRDSLQADQAEVAEIVVTGSRIRHAGSEAISPVVGISADEIQLQGATRIEDVLNSLPAISPSQNGHVNGLGNGTATVDLRQLGPSRTLVLIDGKRLLPGDPVTPAPDLNNVPTALVERIDVLTGGASAVYGSDAVAGVVNFILKRDFEGIAFDTSIGVYNHKNDSSIQNLVRARGDSPATGSAYDGWTKDFNITFGANTADGRGNVTAYLGYRNIDGVSWDKRDFSSCVVQSNAAGHYCGGSAGTAPALLIPVDGRFLTIDSGSGLLRPYTDGDSYNFADSNVLQREDSRYVAGALMHYQLHPSVDLYSDITYMRNQSLRQQAPDGVYGTYDISCDSPLLSADQVNVLCTQQGFGANDAAPVTVYRRNVEGGLRPFDIQHESFRAVIGARGEFATAWNYDVYAQYGRTKYDLELGNMLAQSRIARAIDSVPDPLTGEAVCASTLSGADPSCVVYNPFAIGGVTPEALEYMSLTALQTGSTTERIIAASISGNLGEYGVQLPWTDQGVSIAFGPEYRREALVHSPDDAFRRGEIEGTVVSGTSGSIDIKEYFGELRIPLVSDHFLMHSVALETGYRKSDYSTAGEAEAYKFAGEWAPTRTLRFRGGYNRAVRAPTLVELFTAQTRTLTPTQDPCAGATPTASLANCAYSGVTAAQYGTIAPNPSGQYSFVSGGNPNLRPEIADTTTVGLVFTPNEWLEGLNITLDYFDIEVEGYVSSVPGALSLSQCVATGNPVYCNLVQRDPTSGSLWIGNRGVIDGRLTNAGSLRTSGLDVNVGYTRPIAMGSIGLALSGTKLDKREIEALPDVRSYDCAETFGTTCGQPSPNWRHKLRATWYTPMDIDVSLSWRYIGSVKSDRTLPEIGGVIPPVDASISAQNYFDLAANWRMRDKVNVSLSINNVLDRTPPIIGANYILSYSNGGTYPGLYDLLGRYISLGLRASL